MTNNYFFLVGLFLPALVILFKENKFFTPKVLQLLTICFTCLSLFSLSLFVMNKSSVGLGDNSFVNYFIYLSRSDALVISLFNFIFLILFFGFGQRMFLNQNIILWILIQVLLSIGLIFNNLILLLFVIYLLFILHAKASETDVFQVSTRGSYYLNLRLWMLINLVLLTSFCLALIYIDQIYLISELALKISSISSITKVIGITAICSILGIFPFHVWIRSLFTAPTRYGLAVIVKIQIGILIWSKFKCIFIFDSKINTLIFIGLLAFNLVYATLLLFGEKKITQISSALYLFHISLILIATVINKGMPVPEVLIHLSNMLIGITGLVVVLNMLRDRIGADVLDYSAGLAISYPVFGLTFLFCVLSLIGFPGTLGFISSELLLHHLIELLLPVALIFIFVLALNGYSCFRIFGESFYGNPNQSYQLELQALLREKIAIGMIFLFLLLNGLGPERFNKVFDFFMEIIPSAHAQDDSQLWSTFITSGKLGDAESKAKFYLELQDRYSLDRNYSEKTLLRPGIGYKINSDTALWLGYAWTPNYLNSNLDKDFKNEHRIWEQLTYDDKLSDISINYRLRLEQRFIEDLDEVANRSRYLLKISKPIIDKYNFGLTGYDEFFYNLNSTNIGPHSGFDRNRTFLGSYLQFSNLRYELGYLKEFSKVPNKTAKREIDGLALSVNYSFK